MKTYKIWFTFLNTGRDTDAVWHRDFLDNNGKGFTAEQAKWFADDLKRMDSIIVKDIVFEDLSSELFYKEV